MSPRHKPSATVSTGISFLDAYVRDLEVRARNRLSPGKGDDVGDPQILHRRGESMISELEREAAVAPDSLLLRLPDSDLPWIPAFETLLERSRLAVASPDAHVAPAAPVKDTLQAAFVECEAIRDRVLQACLGSEPKSKASLARKAAVLGRPAFSASKSAWENELRSIIIAINTDGPHQTPALKHLVPRIQKTLDNLERAKPKVGGRPTKKARWGEAVVVSQAMLALAIDELVQWASGVADDARNAAILRIASPKRRGDETGPSDPAARKTEPAKKTGDAPNESKSEPAQSKSESGEAPKNGAETTSEPAKAANKPDPAATEPEKCAETPAETRSA